MKNFIPSWRRNSLKVLALGVLLGGLASVAPLGAAEDEFIMPLPEEAPPPAPEIDRRPVGFQGIVAQFFQVFRPLQLLNPFAPSYYGSGEQNVSDDEDESVPGSNSPGLIVFGVEW